MSKSMGAAREHSISGFFVFCLIGIFAVLATTLTLFGVRAYRSVYNAAARNTDGQIALSYIQNKVHSGDRENGITLKDMGGISVLALREQFGGVDYETRIFFNDGRLQEYFCDANAPLDLSAGDALAELQSFEIELIEPWLMKVTIERQGGVKQSAHIALRAGEVTAQ